jgi:DNA (cytosine-5)-methyltransferase 1
MNELALFAGAGGGLLGSLLLGWRTVGAVEIADYPRKVLLQRQRDGFLPWFPIWDDIRTFNGRPWRGCVDIITGGFPCQSFSVSGKRRGESDERNLWPETIRTICEVRPEWVLLENVPNLLTFQYFGTILSDLAQEGYDARWAVISAASQGAPHKRERLWIVAHGNQGDSIQPANKICSRRDTLDFSGWWASERGICRVDDGLPNRVERIEALGEAQVPAVVKAAWLLLGKEGVDDETG